jgi:hypothetical protein
MGISVARIQILLGLLTCPGLCQTILNRSDLMISGVPIIESSTRVYQNFFNEVKDLGIRPLTTEARTSLRLTDQELRSLLTVTADLATETRFLAKTVRPLMFEARMEFVESGAISPSLREKLDDLGHQWDRTILDHVQQLKAAFGERRFQTLDDFIQSGKSMFEKPPNSN